MKYQHFNGQKFALYPGSRYWQNTSTTERMHRYVWEFYHGEIPEGYDVHHIDHDVNNNDISNLALIESREHKVLHGKEMSDERRERLRKNLLENVSPKSKGWHRSEEGRAWHKKHWEETGKALYAKRKFKCQNCGKEFESSTATAKFCCNACKSAYRRKHRVDDEEFTCEWCGKKFWANKYGKPRFCCHQCAVEWTGKNRKH